MEAIVNYFTANPAAFTLLAVILVITVLYFIFSKLIKIAIVLIFIILLVVGVQLFQSPADMPGKIKKTIATFKTGGEQIKDKFSSLWQDSKDIADKAKTIPKDVNKLLDAAKEDANK